MLRPSEVEMEMASEVVCSQELIVATAKHAFAKGCASSDVCSLSSVWLFIEVEIGKSSLETVSKRSPLPFFPLGKRAKVSSFANPRIPERTVPPIP